MLQLKVEPAFITQNPFRPCGPAGFSHISWISFRGGGQLVVTIDDIRQRYGLGRGGGGGKVNRTVPLNVRSFDNPAGLLNIVVTFGLAIPPFPPFQLVVTHWVVVVLNVL